MTEHSNGGRTAIVIGGGLAGMLAVTALLGQVETVTVRTVFLPRRPGLPGPPAAIEAV
ncbi:hypothetical protein [Streptomyces platensis]|uniref:hypothetical protein n=1 Tax=Streptomyces platensis TaxID=58346 RepID=UPI0036CEF6C1